MAKTKKRSAPKKVCSKCGRTLHAAVRLCKCGNKFGGKARKVKLAKAKAKRSHLNGNGSVSFDALLGAKGLVVRCGSLEAAKSALDQLGRLVN